VKTIHQAAARAARVTDTLRNVRAFFAPRSFHRTDIVSARTRSPCNGFMYHLLSDCRNADVTVWSERGGVLRLPAPTAKSG